jgi:hypothetical protein
MTRAHGNGTVVAACLVALGLVAGCAGSRAVWVGRVSIAGSRATAAHFSYWGLTYVKNGNILG